MTLVHIYLMSPIGKIEIEKAIDKLTADRSPGMDGPAGVFNNNNKNLAICKIATIICQLFTIATYSSIMVAGKDHLDSKIWQGPLTQGHTDLCHF